MPVLVVLTTFESLGCELLLAVPVASIWTWMVGGKDRSKALDLGPLWQPPAPVVSLHQNPTSPWPPPSSAAANPVLFSAHGLRYRKLEVILTTLYKREEEVVVKEISKEDDDARQAEEKLKQCQAVAKRLDNALLVMRRFISEGNELRTPVTKDDIVSEVARQLNINIHPDNLHLLSPLSSLGEFELPLRLPRDIP